MYPLLYQPYWIINKLCFGQVGWRIFMLILLTYPYPQVSTQNFDYYYQHRAYRQSALPNYERINEPISLEPLVDDYTVDSGYKQTQLRLSQSSDKPVSLHGNGKDSNEYNVGNVDDAISSVRDLDTNANSNENQRRIYRSDETNQPRGAARTSFIKHNPSPSSQLRASSLNAEASQPMMISSSASAYSSASVKSESMQNMFFVGSVMGITFIGIFVVFATGYFVHRINLQRKAAADVEYPAYGVVGPGAPIKEKEALSSVKTASGSSKGSSSSAGGAAVCGAGSLSPSGDRRLAQSAQMYHYHHQKQQMISSEKIAEAGQHPSTSELDSDEEENEEGDYTVYECPGLASTGEMEVKNPLFQDDLTPVSSPSVSNTKPNGPSN